MFAEAPGIVILNCSPLPPFIQVRLCRLFFLPPKNLYGFFFPSRCSGVL